MSMKEYYDTRAPEYDEWYLGLGRFDGIERPDWDEDVDALEQTIAALPAAQTLDVACGTGFLTRHLRGSVTALEQSRRMLAIASERLCAATIVHGDALDLPFGDDSFDRVFTGHFYGHLEEPERERFVAEARRVAPELIVVDAAVRPDRQRAERQQRVLNDGTRFEVYKRHFRGDELAQELGGGEVLLENRWFVAVASRRRPVACSLSSADAAKRQGEWQRLLRGAALERIAVPGGMRVKFRADDAIRAELDRLVDAERTCSPFLELTVEASAEGGLVLTVTAPHDAEPVVQALLG